MDISQSIIFNLFDIISVSEKNVLVYRNGGLIVALRNIGQYTGVKQPHGQGYYYGQRIEGFGTVAIRQGSPGILTPDGFKCFGDAQFRKKLENT
jgi:hypothetical protein